MDRARTAADVGRLPTLKDVAAAAGVSYQTVSRVINGDPRVRRDTRTAVEEAVEDLGYEPSAAARALVTGRSRRLGVLVEDLGQYGPTGTLRGLDAAAAARGWDLALASVPAGAAGDVPSALASLRRRGARVLVLVCATADVVEAALRQPRGLPVVGTSQSFDPLLPATVGIDQREGVRLALDHLLALGRRRIAHLAGPSASLDAAARLSSLQRLLTDRGLTPAAVVRGDWSAGSGAAAAAALPPDVDGLLVANDQMALGALATLRAEGRRVPEDVAVVGFDDVPESAYFAPSLTTVRQDFAGLGARVVDVLDEVLAGAGGERRVAVAPALVVRSSAPAVSGGSSGPP